MNDAATLSQLEGIFEKFLNLALTLGGIAAFIMLIVGGFKFLTSGGDPKQVQSAQSTLTMAIVGLLVAVGAWFILNFLQSFTGNPDLLEFSLTG